jgi:hypothetical protein
MCIYTMTVLSVNVTILNDDGMYARAFDLCTTLSQHTLPPDSDITWCNVCFTAAQSRHRRLKAATIVPITRI